MLNLKKSFEMKKVDIFSQNYARKAIMRSILRYIAIHSIIKKKKRKSKLVYMRPTTCENVYNEARGRAYVDVLFGVYYKYRYCKAGFMRNFRRRHKNYSTEKP